MEGGQYIVEGEEEAQSTTVIFSMSEEVGALANALKTFEVRPHETYHEQPSCTFSFILALSFMPLQRKLVIWM